MNESPSSANEGELRDDNEIIRLCQQGDQRAFTLLVDKYQDRVFWVAYNMLGNAEEAKDVVQDAFVRVFRALDRFDFNMNFYTWFYRIVSNLAIDQLRKLKRKRPVSIEELGDQTDHLHESRKPSAKLEEDELKEGVRAILDELPPHYKIVLVLRDLEGLSCKEIAAVTDTSHPTVRWRLHTARKLFKEKWIRQENRSERAKALLVGLEQNQREL